MTDLARALATAGRVIDAWLPLKIGYDRIPGVSIGIAHRGKLVYAKGFGYADVENRVPVTPSTAFRIASNSKTFTAVGMMQLVERGVVSLEDRVRTYLPWFAAKVKDRDAANITIRQGLAHLGGVFRDGVTPHWTDDRFPTKAELRRSVSRAAVVIENATRFKYSNFGFAVLGAVIEKVTGMSYADYMCANIIEPLGMRRTAPDLTKESLDWLAYGYSRPIPDQPRERFEHCKTNAYASATGFLSTVEDLAKYYDALSLARNTSKLIDRESKKELFRQHWTSPLDGSYGLGFNIVEQNGRRIIGHGGGFPGFITSASLNLDDDIAVFVLTNANDSPAGFVREGIHEMIHRFADPTKDYFAGPRLAKQSRFEGAYRSRWGDQIVVGTGHKLIAFAPQTNSPLAEGTILKPATSTSFVMESPFNFDSVGERARFVIGAGQSKARRLIWGSQPSERIG
jgi:CubicO group peptidase (beta-lactamase class C family)